MDCQAGMGCTGNPIADGLSWLAGALGSTTNAISNAVSFATDPMGWLVQQTQIAVNAVAGVLIPWLLSDLRPNYNLQWWLQSWAVSFGIALFVLAIQLLVIIGRRRRGITGAKDMVESFFVAGPAFMLGGLFGPAIGILLTTLFNAAGDSVAQWAVNSNTQDYFTSIAKHASSPDATSMLGSTVVSLLVLGTLFLSLLGVAMIFILQLATQYLVGAVVPLGFVWIVNPDTRKLGKTVPIIWLALPATQVALILLVGIAFRAINGISLNADPGVLGTLTSPVQSFVNLAVPAVISFIVVFAPLSLLRFIPRPDGGAGTARNSGITPPASAPQVPSQMGRGPRSAQQTAADTPVGQGGGFRWNLPTAPAEPGGGYGYGGSKIGAAGKLAGSGSGGAMNVNVSAAGTAGRHAATAAGTKAGVGAAAGSSGAATAGVAATGVGAPLAVGMLLTNAALKLAHQGSQAAAQAADQAIEHGTPEEA